MSSICDRKAAISCFSKSPFNCAAQEAEADVQVLLQLAAEYSEDARVTLAAAQTAAVARDTTRLGLEKARQVAADPSLDPDTRARAEVSEHTERAI